MRNKIISVILAVIFICASLGISTFAQMNTVGEINDLLDDIVAFNLNKENENDTLKWLANDAGNGTEFYAIAFAQRINKFNPYAKYDLSAFAKAMEKFLDENDVKNAVTKQKYALSLIASGKEDSKYVNEITNSTIGELGIMSFVFGLHLLNNGAVSETHTVETVTDKLLSLQLEDGGWALTGQYSDVDITAMTVQALAPQYKTNEKVTAAIDKAIATLSQKQFDDGDFASYGVANPDSVAQVIIALTSVGIDPLSDERFIKNEKTILDCIKKYMLEDGSFKHTEDGESNYMATYQVFLGLTALNRFYADKGSLFIFEEEEEPIITEDPVENEPEKEETVGQKEPEKTEEENPEEPPVKDIVNIKSGGYKLWVSVAVAGIAVILMIICVIKKQKAGTFILIAAAATLVICIVVFTDIQTADNYYSAVPEKGETVGTVTMQIRCDKIKDQQADHIPEDGVILDTTEFEIDSDDTVYDILTEAARKYTLHLESTGGDGMKYMSGINYIYELAYGDLSGWVYLVNGERPSVGCDAYKLSDGDVIEWHYSLELGNDID